MIQLFLSLDYKIVVEGIETEAHMSFMKKYPEVVLQGYFFAKPAPLSTF
ncbi:hypothetical protein [Exiguobacterium sp. 8H]